MLIKDNIIIVGKVGENDAKELAVLLTSPSPWHVAIHQLILVISKVGEHAIHLEQVSHIGPFCLLMQPQSGAFCERENPTTSPKAISNHIKFLGGWCNYLDWCHQSTLVRISTTN